MIYRLLVLPTLACGLFAQLPPAPTTPLHSSRDRLPTAESPYAARERAARARIAPPAAPITANTAAIDDRLWFDDQSADGTLWALGRTYKASFDGRGFDYLPFLGSEAPRNFPLRVELRTATVGGEPLALGTAKPERNGDRISTHRGTLVEVADLAPHHVEQSFVFTQLPTRGAVAVEIALTGDFAATQTDRGLSFQNAHGGIAYEKALARDAAGRELPLTIDWRGTHAHIEIPAAFVANAQLPLVLDPLLTTISLQSAQPANPLRNPDVARLTVPGITAVCWTRTWSATDEDVYLMLFDASWSLIYGDYIDFTVVSWVTCRIASNAASSSFLVVSQVDSVTPFLGSYIGGRIIDSTGAMLPQFVIEGANQVGLPGNNFRPDVGGDATMSGLAYYTVVFEHEAAPANHDIYYRQITQNGTLRTTAPLPLDTSDSTQINPAIGECNGPTAVGRALVAWQFERSGSRFDYDIHARWIDWNGAPLGTQFQVATTVNNERRPAVSSYANVIGGECAAVAWEDDFTVDNDVVVRLFDFGGNAFSTHLNLTSTAVGGAYLTRNQIFPTVETDGNRFAIGYSEYSGTDYDTYAATATWLPGTQSWRLDDERAALGTNAGTDDYWTRIVADWNFFTPVPNSEYTIVGTAIGTNSIELRRYGGWLPGPLFGTFNTQCGSLGITPSGAPTTGGVVSFSLSGAGPISGFLFGFPGIVNPLPCPSCTVGVSNGVTVPGPNFTWGVPADPAFVNAFLLSIQGWSFGGNACLGAIDISDTVDFIIR